MTGIWRGEITELFLWLEGTTCLPSHAQFAGPFVAASAAIFSATVLLVFLLCSGKTQDPNDIQSCSEKIRRGKGRVSNGVSARLGIAFSGPSKESAVQLANCKAAESGLISFKVVVIGNTSFCFCFRFLHQVLSGRCKIYSQDHRKSQKPSSF